MKILVVDDERAIRNSLKEILMDEGYTVDVAEDGPKGLELAGKERYDVIFCDIKMPGMEGTEGLVKLVEEGIETPVVMISGHADIATAVECMHKGAFDFIEKPLDLNRILITIKNATDKANLAKENKIPLPDEALTAIAGGQDGGTVNCGKLHCPQCSCTKIAYQYEDRGNYYQYFYTCTGCGYEWSERWPKYPDPGIN